MALMERYPSFEPAFHNIVNGNDALFREELLYFIDITDFLHLDFVLQYMMKQALQFTNCNQFVQELYLIDLSNVNNPFQQKLLKSFEVQGLNYNCETNS